MSPDIINGLFEFFGAVVIMLNVRALYRDKVVKGVHWGVTGFFAAWGLWNLFYYPSLDQWFSFAGGCAIVTVNLIWLGQVWYYKTSWRFADRDQIRRKLTSSNSPISETREERYRRLMEHQYGKDDE